MAWSLRLEMVQFHNKILLPSPIRAAAFLQGEIYMYITIGQTSDDRRKIQKNFSGTSVQVQLKQPCDLLHPVFILTWSSSYIHANYLNAPDLGRYYYIDDVNLLTGNRAELHCSVDVLMSYSNDILSLYCVVTRQEHGELSLITDPDIMVKNYSIIDTYPFPTHFDFAFGSYVMQVLGGSI